MNPISKTHPILYAVYNDSELVRIGLSGTNSANSFTKALRQWPNCKMFKIADLPSTNTVKENTNALNRIRALSGVTPTQHIYNQFDYPESIAEITSEHVRSFRTDKKAALVANRQKQSSINPVRRRPAKFQPLRGQRCFVEFVMRGGTWQHTLISFNETMRFTSK